MVRPSVQMWPELPLEQLAPPTLDLQPRHAGRSERQARWVTESQLERLQRLELQLNLHARSEPQAQPERRAEQQPQQESPEPQQQERLRQERLRQPQ